MLAVLVAASSRSTNAPEWFQISTLYGKSSRSSGIEVDPRVLGYRFQGFQTKRVAIALGSVSQVGQQVS
jgi:hypothetical protein